jgi:hypothetical protein
LVGTAVVNEVEVPAVRLANPPLNRVLLLASTVSKFVPLIVVDVPATAVVGVKLVIVGAFDVVTVNADELVADPLGVVTAIVPVVAPAGTETTRLVVVAALTVAAVPLNATVFCAAVELKPMPYSVTTVPIGALFGVNSKRATLPALVRVMLVRLPTASY